MSKEEKCDKSDTLDENRIVLLIDRIDDKNTKEIIKRLIHLDSLNHKKIKMYIHSGGGHVTGGLAIIDIMNMIKSKVDTYITGKAFSSAGLISICGDSRYILKNGYWMIHQLTGGTGRDYPEFIMDKAKWLKRLQKTIYDIIAEHTELTKANYEKLKTGELWFDSGECIKKGIVDKIV